MVVVMLATGAVCSWHFYQLSVVVPLLKARRQRLPLQHTQLAAAAAGHPHHAPRLHGVAAAAAAAQQQNGMVEAAAAGTSTRSPKRRAGVGAGAADG